MPVFIWHDERMYLPQHFSIHEQKKIDDLIRENPFATVLSYPENGRPFINHLPLIADGDVLIGHMSRKNPQWEIFRNSPECSILFQGPHTYISPSWYKSGRDVPTWNYAVVHLHGSMEIVESFREQVDILKKLSAHFDKDWRFQLPADLRGEDELTSAIVSFRFHAKVVEAKFKLSQNRSREDIEGVMDGLSQRKDELSAGVLKLMKENCGE